MTSGFSLYLIRHAQSANNALPERDRVEDPPITNLGRRQASLLAGHFRQRKVTHLLSSGFLRAIETTAPLASATGCQPSIRTELHEVGGCYRGFAADSVEGRPGMTRATLERNFPNFELPDDIDETGWWKSRPRETYGDAQARAERQSRRLLREFQGSGAVVACVIHADFKALLLDCLLKGPYRGYAPADLVNTGVTLLRCQSDGVSVVDFNMSDHLPAELVTS